MDDREFILALFDEHRGHLFIGKAVRAVTAAMVIKVADAYGVKLQADWGKEVMEVIGAAAPAASAAQTTPKPSVALQPSSSFEATALAVAAAIAKEPGDSFTPQRVAEVYGQLTSGLRVLSL